MTDQFTVEPHLTVNPVTDLLSTPIPRHLWHYTSHRGFQGIIESKKIFASDLRFLNDSQEFVHARDLARELANEVLESSLTGEALSSLIRKALHVSFNTGPLSMDRVQIMVASFSDARDQLSQWRGYSGNSSGVSVAFDLSKLRPAIGNGIAAVFAPCVYDISEQKRLLRHARSHLLTVVTGWTDDVQAAQQKDPEGFSRLKRPQEIGPPHVKGPSLAERIEQAMHMMNHDLLRVCPLLKDPSFREEREWRLVIPILMKDAVNHVRFFRPSTNTLVPYIEHPLCGEGETVPVSGLILGPGSHGQAEAASLLFLKAHRINIIPELSKVPYRPS